MKVVDKRSERKKIRFEDLDVGDAYLDDSGTLCIKTSDSYDDANYIYYRASIGDWLPDCEYNYTEVSPIKVTLTIEG